MEKMIQIVGLAGSLRQKSYNKAALRAVQELAPEGVKVDIFDLAPIPFFNEDLEAEGYPAAVAELRKAIASADALILATPEYNYSIPPVLKNALDWASRGSDFPLDGKPAAILSASTGMFGGARAQYHLRQVCVRLNLQLLNRPEVFIASAAAKFNEEGVLIDEYTRNAISGLIKELLTKLTDK